MTKKELKRQIIQRYLNLIKDTNPLEHDLICEQLNIPILPSAIRTSLPESAWRILNRGNEALKEVD